MTALLSLIVGLFVTMVLMPPLVRVSGMLHLEDQPNHRKVHAEPIPRIGGIAIYFGVLVPLLLWVPLEQSYLFYILAAGLIVLFGAIDDRYVLEFNWKLLGQTVAALAVMAGGIRFSVLPFCGLDPVTPWVTLPISFLFILGITNAMNLSDGLDGLASGVALVSLAGIGVLAFTAGGTAIYLGAAALAGAILGFLRFNTHPAVAFLGDSGSQFLGFTLACMAILLTQSVNTALNPMLPLFIVGLPLIDTLSVIVIRSWQRRSPFKPDNWHFHHRLLKLGLRHHEAVALIYLLQGLSVALAILLRYQSDALALVVFVAYAGLIYGVLCALESLAPQVRAHDGKGQSAESDAGSSASRSHLLARYTWLPLASARYVQIGLAVFLLAGPLFVDRPPRDIASVAAGVAMLMVFAHFFLNQWTRLFARIGMYLLSLFTVFLILPLAARNDVLEWGITGYLIVLSVVLALAIRLTQRVTFQMTPQDVLVLFFVLAAPNLPLGQITPYPVGPAIFWTVAVFYASEFVLTRSMMSFRLLRVAGFAGLAILGYRGLL